MKTGEHNKEISCPLEGSSLQISDVSNCDIVDEVNFGEQVTIDTSANERNDASTRIMTCFRTVNKYRTMCGDFINHEKVQLCVVFLISLNAIMMGIATFDFVSENPSASKVFETTDTIFLSIFTVELVMQLIYHGPRLFLDGWLVFDFIIIIMSWSFASLQIIRAFRIFRALRLVTRIKVMKNLVRALLSVMPRMAAISLLLFLVFYIYAVMFTQLFGYLYEAGAFEEDYFGRIDLSFFTLFQIMTLDALDQVSRQLMNEIPWSWFPLLTFVIVSAFIVVNLIIAVLCDAISALHGEEKSNNAEGALNEGDSISEVPPQQQIRDELGVLEDRLQNLLQIHERTLSALTLLTNHMDNVATEVK